VPRAVIAHAGRGCNRLADGDNNAQDRALEGMLWLCPLLKT